MKKIVSGLIKKMGYEIRKIKSNELPADIVQDELFMKIYHKCRPYTMTSIERMFALYGAVRYTVEHQFEGDFIECGVWKGGSSMVIAETLLSMGVNDRELFLYDTFEGMSAPEEVDKAISGETAELLLEKEDINVSESVWCYSSLDEVKANLSLTGYPLSKLHFIKGKVEDTLPNHKHEGIALLRLDTDWYASTKIELELLYPLLVSKGVLIIDDFGHWEGAKRAVIEYFQQRNIVPLLNRLDYTGRLMIKN